MTLLPSLGVETCEQYLGKRIKRLRQKMDVALTTLARELGVSQKYLRLVEDGRVLASAELIRRVTMWAWEGTNWRDFPTLPSTLLKSHIRKAGAPSKNLLRTQNLEWPNTEPFRKLWDKFEATRKALGVSRSAFVFLAIERLCDDNPALFTIREGAREYERLRVDTLREWFPEVALLLDGDASAAKAVRHAVLKHEELRKRTAHPKLEPVGVFDAWSVNHDGPSTPVAPWPPRGYKKHRHAK